MFSIISLLLVMVSSILVTRIATVALTHTGLSRESAKFQARSAFTGVGFTTQESEKVVNHPVRRKVLLILMLLGNAGFITAISSLIVSFVKIEGSFSLFWRVALLVSGVVILWGIANSAFIDRHLSNLISKGLKKYTRFVAHDFSKLLHLAGDYQISELYIGNGHWMEGETISRSAIRKEGLTVLGITRNNGDYLGVPDGETMIEHGDTVIIYGKADTISNLGRRKDSTKGDYEHVNKVKKHQAAKKIEKEKEI